MDPKIIISGGGTGGHIFPALAIANALKRINTNCDILFVGAIGRMEMEKIPAAGYPIKGLNIMGINRKSILKNLLLPFKIIESIYRSRQIISNFKPHVAVGVGGFASGPLLYAASQKKIPYLIQEQNSYAGKTNRWLSGNASKICVAFDKMDAFFPADKIIKTGNPIRKEMLELEGKKAEGLNFWNFDPAKKNDIGYRR